MFILGGISDHLEYRMPQTFEVKRSKVKVISILDGLKIIFKMYVQLIQCK